MFLLNLCWGPVSSSRDPELEGLVPLIQGPHLGAAVLPHEVLLQVISVVFAICSLIVVFRKPWGYPRGLEKLLQVGQDTDKECFFPCDHQKMYWNPPKSLSFQQTHPELTNPLTLAPTACLWVGYWSRGCCSRVLPSCWHLLCCGFSVIVHI